MRDPKQFTKPLEKEFLKLDTELLARKMDTLEAKFFCFSSWWREELKQLQRMTK